MQTTELTNMQTPHDYEKRIARYNTMLLWTQLIIYLLPFIALAALTVILILDITK
jgi:hypothetical protein